MTQRTAHTPSTRRRATRVDAARIRRARLVRTLIVALVLVIAGVWTALAVKVRHDASSGADSGSRPATATPASQGPVVKPAAQKSAENDPDADGVKFGSFLGGETRRSYGLGPAPQTLKLIWKVKLGSGPTQRKSDNKLVSWAGNGWTGQCTVVRDGGRDYLLVGAYDHNLHRIDALTGKVIWESPWDDVIKGTNTVFENPSPKGADDRIIVAAGSRRGSKYAVGDPRIAPFKAVSFATGKELWRLPVPKTPQYSQDVDSSSLFLDGVLYVPVESGYVYGVDPNATEPWKQWRAPVVKAQSPPLWTSNDVKRHPDVGGANIAIEASPARLGDRLFISSGAGHVYGLSLPDLAIAWDYRTGSDIDGTPAVNRQNRLLVTVEKQYIAGHGGALMLDPSKPPAEATAWFFPTPDRGIGEWAGGSVGSVAINDEYDTDGSRPSLAAFTSVDGNLYVVSQDTMALRTVPLFDGKGAYPTPVEVFHGNIGASIGTPAFVGDTIVAAGYANTVYLYKVEYARASAGTKAGARSAAGVALPARDGTLWNVLVRRTASYKAGGAFEATPLVWKGRVYVGSRDGYLYCLGDR